MYNLSLSYKSEYLNKLKHIVRYGRCLTTSQRRWDKWNQEKQSQLFKSVDHLNKIRSPIIHKKSHSNVKNNFIQNNKTESLASYLVNSTSSNVQPYLKLMRLDYPTGTWLLYYPCTWSIALAADPGTLPSGFYLFLFGCGAVVMRGAGCTINDLWDKDIDQKVERTKLRPLVTGEITPKKAVIFLAGQLSVALAILLQLNWFSVFLGASSLFLVIIYPLMKRITHWPQLFLGMTFNWGTLLGWTAVHSSFDISVCLPLYIAGICWTIVYDTIYAHQDKADDMLLGIKSTAIIFGEDTKKWLSLFSTGMVASLITCGIQCEQMWPYFASVAAIATHLTHQIYFLNIHNPNDCKTKFMSNQTVGLVLFIGIVLGNLLKPKNQTETQGTDSAKVLSAL